MDRIIEIHRGMAMRGQAGVRPPAVLAVVLDRRLGVVAAVSRSEQEPDPDRDRDTAERLVAEDGPGARHRLREIGKALRGSRVTFGTTIDGRTMTCTAEPMSVTGGTATHVLIMVHDATSGDNGHGPVRDRGPHLDDGDREVLTELAAGKTQLSIASSLKLTRRGLDHRVARLRRNLGESSLTLTGLVASTYAAGILVSDAWPPHTRDLPG